jgi:hypothetical protein
VGTCYAAIRPETPEGHWRFSAYHFVDLMHLALPPLRIPFKITAANRTEGIPLLTRAEPASSPFGPEARQKRFPELIFWESTQVAE